MESKEFRQRGREMVDYIAEYMESVGERRVTPAVEPGYLRDLIPKQAPQSGEGWDAIMSDVEDKIMPGVTHWQHPRFHAYFPSGNSFPSILGDMLSDGIGCIGFSWAASPACTELETIVLDWLGQMIGLPGDFLSFTEKSKGGGVMQSSASECVLVSLLAARAQKIKELKSLHPFVEEGVLLSKLIAYCSKEAHSCVEKAAMIAFVKLRILDPDEHLSLRGATLAQAMEEDRALGLVPFFVSATLGTTSCVSFDNLAEIGPIAKAENTWLHVDAAYAGNSFICPEFQYLMKGIEHAMSFNCNPNKWLLTNFDCSTMWVRDRFKLTQAMVVDPLYLQHSYSDKAIDYRHWGIPLSRRFRALKLWFVIRNYGVEGLQKYIREHCRLAKRFESLVLQDGRFEVCNQVKMGLVCFRVKGNNELNQKLLSNINESGKLHMVPASVHGRYVIRFCVCAQDSKDCDIDYAWDCITDFAAELLESELVKERSGLPLPILESSNQEVATADTQRSRILRDQIANDLKYKRSFFVRMVSDPKIYNPKIVAKSMTVDHSIEESKETCEGLTKDGAAQPSSWISWPLGLLLQGVFDDTTTARLRFRNWDTRVTLKPPSRSRSKSPHTSSNGSSRSESPEKY